jgi:NADH-quinone oxidoreductase subunit G
MRAAAADAAAPVELRLNGPTGAGGLHRIGDVPIYAVDALCRSSAPLQRTVHAANDWLGLNPADAGRLGLADGAMARVSQGGQSAEFEVRVSEKVPEGGAWLRSATCATRKFGNAFAPIDVEVA